MRSLRSSAVRSPAKAGIGVPATPYAIRYDSSASVAFGTTCVELSSPPVSYTHLTLPTILLV